MVGARGRVAHQEVVVAMCAPQASSTIEFLLPAAVQAARSVEALEARAVGRMGKRATQAGMAIKAVGVGGKQLVVPVDTAIPATVRGRLAVAVTAPRAVRHYPHDASAFGRCMLSNHS